MQDSSAMNGFIVRQNIEHFSNLLQHERDLSKRAQLEEMLAEETAKLHASDQQQRSRKLG